MAALPYDTSNKATSKQIKTHRSQRISLRRLFLCVVLRKTLSFADCVTKDDAIATMIVGLGLAGIQESIAAEILWPESC